MHRRDFLRSLPKMTTGLVAGGAALPLTGCAGTVYVAPRVRGGGLVIPASALADEGVFVQPPGMGRPLYLHRDEAGEVIAVLASCTHQGCQPEPSADRLVCPCHGSEFSRSGSVLQGPAERPLARYPVREEGAELVVLLDRVPR